MLWQRTDFVCNHFRGAGSSPFIYRNLLILHFDGSRSPIRRRHGQGQRENRVADRSQRGFPGPRPGRASRTAKATCRKAFSTPVVIAEVNGKPLLISLGSMALYGYEPVTGKERLACGMPSAVIPVRARPVLGHGLVFVADGAGIASCGPFVPTGKGS